MAKIQTNNLADKINKLLTVKPTYFDSDEESEDTKAKVVERYIEDDASDNDFQPSKIRRQTIDTLDRLDKRYAGKKVSRKDIYSDENEKDNINENIESSEESSQEDVEDEETNNTLKQSDNELDTDEENSQQESDDDKSISDSEEKNDNYNTDMNNSLYKQKDSSIKTISETNIKTEIEKGNCVRNQLKLWESILEMRIKLQKCVVINNQMPQHDAHKELRSDINFVTKTNETKTKLVSLLENLVQLQDILLKQYPETKNLCSSSNNKRKATDGNTDVDDPTDEEIPSDTEDENNEESPDEEIDEVKEEIEPVPRKRMKFENYEKLLQKSHNSYTEYRNSVIKKWNEKTRIATGSLSKNAGQTTLKQIEFGMSDMNKLRKKTRLKRSEYNIVGKSLPSEDEDGRRIQEYDPEIFDDDDFYHQLLRDLIEYKSSNVTDPLQLSKQWVQLQNMRKKMKRKIDTRATKGRRVRYNVHNKLVNFMTPITIHDTWTNSAKNELYNSLFGKIKSKEGQTK